MKKIILPLSLLFASNFAMAQVGIGTRIPDNSAMLDVQVSTKNPKGVLLPRVPLQSLKDNSIINKGKVTNSLLVFNTTNNAELNSGYYYWFDNSWIRILTDQDNISRDVIKNEEFAVDREEQTLYLKDSNQNMLSVPLVDINTLTTLENKGKGTYVYTAEDNSQSTIDVVGDVVNNFEDIISNEDVQNTLNQYFTNALPLGNVTYVQEGDSYVFKYLDEKGENQTINISEIVKSLETITTITPETKDGKNTGKYVYKNEELAEVTIDVVGDVINNFDEIIENKDVQNNLYVTVKGKAKDLSSDRSIVVTDGEKALLNKASIAIANEGVHTRHIKDKTVTAGKISSETIKEDDKVLTTNGIGGAEFKDISSLVTTVSKGNIEGNESIAVKDGIDVILGGEDKKVTLSLKTGGVKEDHLAATSVSTTKLQDAAVTTEKVADAHITAKKLTAGVGPDNRVAIANATGEVTYQTIDSNVIEGVGSISTDNIIAVEDGVNKTLGDVSLSINDASITANKLSAKGAEANAVATADVNGNVAYKPLSTSALTGAGSITTDGVVTVDNGQDKVLSNVSLGLATNSIKADHLQKDAVTTDKIAGLNVTIDKLGSGDEEENSIITTDGKGGFRYATVAQLGNKAFELSTDEVIEVLEGGEHAVLVETKIGIKNNSITKAKLNSENQDIDMLLVTDGKGGFDYVQKEAVQAGGVDLHLDPALTFRSGNGLNSVLANMTIGVADKGIQNTHLNDGIVTTAKMTAEDALTNSVLTAIGEGKVAYTSMNDLVFDAGKDLKADKSITVASGNKALLKETSIAVANNGILTNHIADATVTTAKINAEKAAANTVLTAIGEGKVAYKSMDDLVFNQGAKVSSDESIEVKGGDKAALQAMSLKVKKGGIKTSHIANNQVTSAKMSSEDATGGFVLVADGNGGVKYEDINAHISIEGEELKGVGAIEVTDGAYALLTKASVDIKPEGVTTDKLANGAVITSKIENRAVKAGKISSTVITQGVEKTYDKGSVLVADGKGGVSYESLSGQGKKVSTDYSISVAGGDKAVLNDMTISVANKGIKEEKIAANAVTTDKIKNQAVSYYKINSGRTFELDGTVKESYDKGSVLVADGKGGASWNNNISSTPTIFYLPAIYIEVVSSSEEKVVDLYSYYKTQFGTPAVKSEETAELPVYDANTLNYFVTYFDKDVFKDVKVDKSGKMRFRVVEGAKPSEKTFFNVVLQVKQ